MLKTIQMVAVDAYYCQEILIMLSIKAPICLCMGVGFYNMAVEF